MILRASLPSASVSMCLKESRILVMVSDLVAGMKLASSLKRA